MLRDGIRKSTSGQRDLESERDVQQADEHGDDSLQAAADQCLDLQRHREVGAQARLLQPDHGCATKESIRIDTC